MGDVYRARDPRLGRDVAIKFLPSRFSADSDRLRRFEQEARAAAALNHPNILTVHEIGAEEGSPYVVSELLEGQTLRAFLGASAARRGTDPPMPVKTAIEYAIQISKGLAAAHEKGVIHRDLKPENLFVTRDGRVKLLDFGLAKLMEPRLGVEPAGLSTQVIDTTPGVVMGTVGYMSPEQLRGRAVDHRSDIFSSGAISVRNVVRRARLQRRNGC
jgi:serine/threonine protein kinase